MAERKINPIVKQVLELGPTLVFFLIYMRIKDQTFTFAGTEYSGFIVAALILVPILMVATLILWLWTGGDQPDATVRRCDGGLLRGADRLVQ